MDLSFSRTRPKGTELVTRGPMGRAGELSEEWVRKSTVVLFTRKCKVEKRSGKGTRDLSDACEKPQRKENSLESAAWASTWDF